MYRYNVTINKVSGRLNESVLPSKSLVVESKSIKTKEKVLSEASDYIEKKYGLMIEDADVELASKPKRKAPLKKEVFTVEDLKRLCVEEGNYDGREYNYRGQRVTPDGRTYELDISTCATSGKAFWVWTGSPYIKYNAKAVAFYDGFVSGTHKWQKKRNNFIELVD